MSFLRYENERSPQGAQVVTGCCHIFILCALLDRKTQMAVMTVTKRECPTAYKAGCSTKFTLSNRQLSSPMRSFILSLSFIINLAIGALGVPQGAANTSSPAKRVCRNIPGDLGFPSTKQLAIFNATVGGRLVSVVPFAQFCKTLPGGTCSLQQYTSAKFRLDVPGAMNMVRASYSLLSR